MTNYFGQAIPAKVVRVSNTTLYHVAADELGDAMWWPRIAQLNNLSDPWIGALTELKIPSPINGSPDGVLGNFPTSIAQALS